MLTKFSEIFRNPSRFYTDILSDPLYKLSEMLTDAQLSFYQENGYVVLDSVFSTGELEECSAEYDQLFERKKQADLEATWQGDWKNDNQSKSTSVSTSFSFFLRWILCGFISIE